MFTQFVSVCFHYPLKIFNDEISAVKIVATALYHIKMDVPDAPLMLRPSE